MKFKGTTRKQCNISGLIVWQINLEKKGLRSRRFASNLTEKNHIVGHENMSGVTIDYHQQFDNKNHKDNTNYNNNNQQKKTCELNNDKIEQECERKYESQIIRKT